MLEEELEAELSSTMELSRDSRSMCALRALPARKFSRLRCFRCWETDTEAAIPIKDVGELVATKKAAYRRLPRGIRIQLSVCNMPEKTLKSKKQTRQTLTLSWAESN